MKKKDFISELMEYGIGFAMSFLIVLGLAAAMIIFLALVMFVAFLERLMH